MITNIYQAQAEHGGTETVILCDTCYMQWNPVGAIRKLAQAQRNTPCEMCQPDKFGEHLEDMKRELDNE